MVSGSSDSEELEVPAPTGHKNQTWDPELRIETLDPDRNWIACFIHDTGFDHNRSRARQAQLTS